MNLAGIWKLPVIYVCENNRYAESTPFEFVVAGQSVANRASGYDMPGVPVDGHSVLDMYEVSKEAVKRARSGEGPTLIEAHTYRYQGHFGADNTLAYRTEEEEVYYHERDCIARTSKYLLESGYVTEDELKGIDVKAIADVEKATKFANESPFPEDSELTTDVYVSY